MKSKITLNDVANLHKGNKEEIIYYYKQIKFLTKDNPEEEEKFLDIYYNQANRIIGSALQRYKKILRQNGRGNVAREEIVQAYRNNDINKLCELLSELTLECITTDDWIYIYNYMLNKKMTIEELYNKFMERPSKRLISIVM